MATRRPQITIREPLDLHRKGVLRYVQLATLFRRKIETGEWSNGAQIPTIVELAEECGVARETIRQALGILQRDGLIQRRRAKGTFVTGDQKEQLWCELTTSYFGLLQAREGAEIELLSEARGVTLPAAMEFGTPVVAYRHVKRRHWRNDQPYLLADVFIAEDLVKRIPRAALSRKTALKLLADIPGIDLADVEQTLTIGSADLEMSEMLQMELNAPVAHVNRYALDSQGDLLLFARGAYRADIVKLNIKLK